MSLSHQTLSPEDLNLLRNDLIKFDCGPMVYQTILEWGFEKPKSLKIIEHFKDKKIEENCGRNLKNWLKNNKKTLESTDFSSFDITILHDLLPVLCYHKLTQSGTKEWEDKLKDTNSIEYLLKEIKSFRNDVSHEYSKAKNDPNIEEKNKLMAQCIRTAGALYSKHQSEIDAKVANLNAKFANLMQNTSSSYENAVQHVTKKIERECPIYMLEKYSPLFNVPLPGGVGKIDSSEIFEAVNIAVAAEDKNETKMAKDATVKVRDDSKNNKIVISSSEICKHVSNTFVVINGGPGSGKTTLMRHLHQNILDYSSNGSVTSYEDIDRFRVPIYLECRTERQNNLRDFLKESFPNSSYSKDVIYESFKKVEGQVFLIDGYDEVNDDSRKLIDQIIPYCRDYNATCIVSGRVDAGNNFIIKLNERNLTYKEMLIEPIIEMSDKLIFLRRYGDKMRSVDSDELVGSFESLNDSAQKVFISPILLALFITMFLRNGKSLSQLHNEQSAYKEIREIFSDDIEKKLRENNIKNPELKTELLLEVFSDYSLRLFVNEEYFFGKNEIVSLTKDCLRIMPNEEVDIKEIFSCILTPETSLKSGKTTYAFTHSSIQEYLAVEQIIKNMKDCSIHWHSEQNSEDSLREQFLAFLGVSISLSGEFTSLSGESSSLSGESTSLSDVFFTSPSSVSTSIDGLSTSLTEVFFTSPSTLSTGVSLSPYCVSTSVSDDVLKKVRRYHYVIKLLILETKDRKELDKFARTFTAVLREYFVTKNYYSTYVYPDYLLGLVSSSNCDSAIVSIVSNILRFESDYLLRYTRHIRPCAEVLKKRPSCVDIQFNCYQTLTDTDCANLCQLMSVLESGSRIKLILHHSHINYQPLNVEFYTQLNNSKCKVNGFTACVTSSEDLSSLIRAWRGCYSILYISTLSVAACDISFATLEGHIGSLDLMVKYTDACPTTGSNPVPKNTDLIITDIPPDGKDEVCRLIKYFSPKSKPFKGIKLYTCHLTDTGVYELLKKLEGEKIRTKGSRGTYVDRMRVNEDKSRNFSFHLGWWYN